MNLDKGFEQLNINAMKTKFSSGILVLFATATLVLASCKKDTIAPSTSGVLPSYPTDQASLGNIVDYGLLTPDVRVMKTELTAQDYTLTGTDGAVSGSGSQVAAAFYVNADGSIPTGEYLFSDTPEKSPFTFDSGAVLGMHSNNPDGMQTDQIVGGKITVQQNGNSYQIAVEVNLASGMVFNGTYNGRLDYADSK